MESEVKQRNDSIKSCVKLVFLYILFVMGLSTIVEGAAPDAPKVGRIICALLGTLYALKKSDCAPEKGTLLRDNQPMTAVTFVVVLGAFVLSKLLSLGPSALLLKLFVNEENAEALQGLSSVEENVLLSFLDLGIVTAFCEETVFRGCVGRTFEKYGVRFAMLMSTLLFALYHCNLFQLVSTFLPGLVLFYVASRYSIKWSMLLHFINNGLLSICFTGLKKVAPDAFFSNYGEYVVEALLIVAALCLVKKDNAGAKVKEFLNGPRDEEGVYKAAVGNRWFVLVVLAMALLSAALLFMLDGGMDVLPAAA